MVRGVRQRRRAPREPQASLHNRIVNRDEQSDALFAGRQDDRSYRYRRSAGTRQQTASRLTRVGTRLESFFHMLVGELADRLSHSASVLTQKREF
jgi:hypothetical protein